MTTPSDPVALADWTWTELDAARPHTLVVPLGSTEQHGPHLPLDLDTLIATEVATRAATGLPGVVVAPALPFGAAGEHVGFFGTLSIGTEALALVLVELVRSCVGPFSRVVLVSGHGGNLDAVREAVEYCRAEGRQVDTWWPTGGDAHAGHTETSVALALCPDRVRTELMAPGVTTPLAQIADRLRSSGVAAVSPTGVLGDPTTASAADGRAQLAVWADSLAEQLRLHDSDPTHG